MKDRPESAQISTVNLNSALISTLRVLRPEMVLLGYVTTCTIVVLLGTTSVAAYCDLIHALEAGEVTVCIGCQGDSTTVLPGYVVPAQYRTWGY